MLVVSLLLVPFVLFAVVLAAEPPGGYYTTRYDHIDVDNILNQKRLVHYYTECLLDRGPCTPQGLEFKRILPEAIQTNCLRCTEKQWVVTLRSIRRLKKQYPDVWAQLAKSWDPTGEYVRKLEESYDRSYSPRSPTVPSPTLMPLPMPTVIILGERFGGIGGDNDVQSQTSTMDPVVSSATFKTTTFKTLFSTMSTLPSITRDTASSINAVESSSSTETTSTATTSKIAIVTTTNTGVLSSIGVNLVVPNPARIIDAISNKVVRTAGMVFDTVNFVLKG